MRYELRVDGRQVAVEAEPSTPLLLCLRNDAGVFGPKLGCGLGQCGACTVLIDGEPVFSCVRRMSSLADGAAITTVAGLGTPERPHPVQAAFIAEQALQCGYCASGMIVASAALLAKNPDPTDTEIREALEGHLCRCGTHDRILRAVKRAAGKSGASAAALGLFALATGEHEVGEQFLSSLRLHGGHSRSGSRFARVACSPHHATDREGAQTSCTPTPTGWPESSLGATRRSILGASGFLLLGFCLGGRTAFGQQPAPPPVRLPGSLASNKNLDAWLRIGADGTVTVLSGKVELGQGIRTALAQIVADELDVAIERLRMVAADTDLSPDESYTSGSMSIQQSGAALRQAAAEARLVLLELAAARLGVAVAALSVDDGRIAAGAGGSTSYWELVSDTTLRLEATGRATPKAAAARRLVGRPVQRLDIPGKVFGEAVFIHDLQLPGMLHARVVRPPSYGARLASIDAAAARALPGVVHVVRDGSFLAVVAEREEQAIAAAEALATAARWEGASPLPTGSIAEWLRGMPSREGTVSSKGADPAAVAAAKTIEAEYAKPFIAHASLGPSCAVAQVTGDRLRVWTHGQGVFPMRAALAKLLGIAPDRLRVTHLDGAGCYGHNGADDAACDAALIARSLCKGSPAPPAAGNSKAADTADPPAIPCIAGRPVRVQWSRRDEQTWAPFGSAMAIRARGGLDAKGNIASWSYDLWSHTHSTRPGRGEAGFVAAWHLASPQPPAAALNIPQPAGGEDRNAVPLYDFASQRVVEHFVPDMPVRVSALRSLGAFANVFAIESFMDELAAAAGADPVEFRLRHLSDARGRAVIEAAARAAGWKARSTGSGDRGRAGLGAENEQAERTMNTVRGAGFAFARYKNQAAYVALVAEVAVDRAEGTIRVERMTAAVDAGDVVNPDGLRNQIEGGMMQAASWTLYEEVAFDRERITSVDWRSYPIARFGAAPQVSVEVVERPNDPPVGAGEAAQGPAAAAIANALFAATGARLRDLPLRPQRVRAAL